MKKLFKNIWLCLKYPFLYPRNRFTGLHYNNWKIQDLIRNKSKEAYLWVDIKQGKVDRPQKVKSLSENISLILDYEYGDDILIITKYKSGSFCETILKKIKVGSEIKDVSWAEDKNEIIINVKNKWNLGKFHAECLIIDSIKNFEIKCLKFFHNWILSFFHCIPEYTELDTMEDGWRKRYGENLCKEIKKELIKAGGWKLLYKFRVTQIKEKWGELRFYCGAAPKGVYEVISKYEDLTSRTCHICGKDAVYRSTGYILPYCEDCIPDKIKETAEKIDESEFSLQKGS